MTLIRSQYALDDLPEHAVVINVTDEVTAQKRADGWQLPGRTGAYGTDDLMSAYPGPWQVLYKGHVPPITVTIDNPRPRPAYCRCDFR